MENFLSDHQTVGTLLRGERERQGKSLGDVSEATHIRRVFLQYIEEDNFDELPSKLHITGFLSVYSHYLGLSEQLVMSRYKKQMLLLQEIPSEELFSISQDSSSNKRHIRPWVYIFCGFVIVSLIVASVYSYFVTSENSPKEESKNILTQPLEISVEVGKDFSFFVKNREVRYRLLDVTNQSVTLMDLDQQITLPPFLHSEGLEYDIDGNHEYDYIISMKGRQESKTTFLIAPIRVVRNPGQDSYAIVKLSRPDELAAQPQGNQKGILTLKNTSMRELLLIAESADGSLKTIKILPQRDLSIAYFDEQQKAYYHALFLQDVQVLHIQIDGQDVTSSQTAGSVGVLACTLATQKESSPAQCSIVEGI